MFQFVVPAACPLAMTGLSVYMAYLLHGPLLGTQLVSDAINSPDSRAVPRTALTTLSILCGLLLMLFVRPHSGPPLARRTLAARCAGAGAHNGIAVISLEPRLRSIFELEVLSLADYVVLAFVAAIWTVVLLAIWRGRLLERLLGGLVRNRRAAMPPKSEHATRRLT